MTIARQITEDGDFTFGKGRNNYVRNNGAIVQDINTRLSSFLGDCFFDLGAGLDWFNLLGAKDQTALNLAVSAVILNTANVTGILQIALVLDADRNFTVTYKVQTTYSTASSIYQYSLNGIG